MTQTKNILFFLGSLYIIYALEFIFPFSKLGIIPRTQKGLIGIATSPFLHANIKHLISNTIPLGVLLFVTYQFYPKKVFPVICTSILIGGLLVWLFGRDANHIGASGLIYGLAAFLIVNGFVEQKFVPLLVSVAIIIFYGGLFWGMFPSMRSYISWEGHLFGAIAGVVASFVLKK